MKPMRYAILAVLLLMLITLCACNPSEAPDETSADVQTTEAVAETTEATTVAEETTVEETVAASESETITETESESATEEVTLPDMDVLPFFDGNRYKYILIRPAQGEDDVLAANQADFDFLIAALTDLCGKEISTLELPNAGSGTVIATSTPSISLRYAGEQMDYAVRIDQHGAISLTGGCPETLQRAVYTFLGSFLRANADGTVDLINTGDFVYDYSEDKIDNSSMLEYIPSDQVTLSPSNFEGNSTLMSPDWMETLIMVEVRLDTASIGGSFQESYDLIDFYASMGVNGIWLTPIYDFGISNGYGNSGPHTIDPRFTGTEDYEAGWLVAKEFVDYAHSKGIYIFLDVVTWGSWGDSPLVEEHPDWYDGMSGWGGPAYNWKNEAFVEWFKQTCVNNILTTGADGFRCDCEPGHAGYDVFEDIRNRLAAEGKYIMLMGEDKNTRNSAFDIEQDGVNPIDRGTLYANGYNFFVDGQLDIVVTTLRGRGLAMGGGDYRFYTNCLCNHDYHRRAVQGNRLKIGYAAILAPYIPLWYQGEEFNATTRPEGMYAGLVDHAEIEIPANNLFFEDVKAMIAIRRSYPDLFAYWPLKHIDTNLCGVTIKGWEDPNAIGNTKGTALSAYARYVAPENEKATTEGVAFLVVPNHVESVSGVGEITIPVEDAYLEGYTYFKVTDMSTGRVIAYVDAATPTFTATIPYNYAGMYLVEGV